MRDTPENRVLRATMLAWGGAEDVVLWRHSTGEGLIVSDTPCRKHEQRRCTECARRVAFGLGVGGADLVGIGPGGRFLAIACKAPNKRPEPHQLVWLRLALRRGAFVAVVRDETDAVASLAALRVGADVYGWAP